MKTLLIALSFIATGIFGTANAAEVIDNPQSAFAARFGGAREVQWTESGSLYKVRFTLDGVASDAFYTADGTLVALARRQSAENLPAGLRAALDLKGRWISDLVEMSTDNGTTWVITVEDADRSIVLQSVNDRKWVRFEQSSKL